MEILVIIILILLNGILSLSEMSLVSARKFKLENEVKKGNERAKIALEVSQNPTKLLSTVQIGITVIGILLGIFSGANITDDFEKLLSTVPWLMDYAHMIAVGVVVVLITYFSIVFGELLPKRIGLTYPESIAIVMARPMQILALLNSPFVL